MGCIVTRLAQRKMAWLGVTFASNGKVHDILLNHAQLSGARPPFESGQAVVDAKCQVPDRRLVGP